MNEIKISSDTGIVKLTPETLRHIREVQEVYGLDESAAFDMIMTQSNEQWEIFMVKMAALIATRGITDTPENKTTPEPLVAPDYGNKPVDNPHKGLDWDKHKIIQPFNIDRIFKPENIARFGDLGKGIFTEQERQLISVGVGLLSKQVGNLLNGNVKKDSKNDDPSKN